MDDRTLLEMIDACRPHGQDLRDAVLSPLAERLEHDRKSQDLFERVQQLDVAIAAAIDVVPVPEGLAARIMARLDAASQPTVAAPHASALDASGAPQLGVYSNDSLNGESFVPATVQFEQASGGAPVIPHRMHRRRWLTAATMSSLAAGVLGGVVYVSQRPREYTPDEVRQEVLAFHGSNAPAVKLTNLPAGLPPSRWLRLNPQPPRRVSGLLGRDGVVYEWYHRGTRVSLYAVRMRVPGLSKSPFSGQGSGTGLPSAAWQEGGLLYVLVIDGPLDVPSVLRRQQQVA
jgi:hypothetical protein